MKIDIINNKRIFRYFLAVMIALFLSALVFGNNGIIQKAKAESGSITITNTTNFEYIYNQGNTGAGGTALWTRVYIDNLSYNHISNFKVSDNFAPLTFAHSFEQTSFTCTENAVICNGIVWYDANQSSVYYVFLNDPVLVNNTLNLTFSNPFFIYNITVPAVAGFDGAPISSQPLSIGYTEPTHKYFGGNIKYSNVVLFASTTDTYDVSYFQTPLHTQYFTVNVSKGKSINDRWIISTINNASMYAKEISFNKVDFNFSAIYAQGIEFNVSIQSGDYIVIPINNTGFTGNLISGNIAVNKNSYNKTESVNISYNINTNSSVTDQKIKIRLPTGEVINSFILSGSNQHLNFYIPNDYPIGNYIVYLQYEYLGLTWFTLDTKYFTVITQNNISSVEFLFHTVDLSQRLTAQYYTNQSGYINILDSSNNIKLNISSLIINTTTEINYNFKQTDLTGTWIINLYNSNGNLTSTDSAYVNFGIVDTTPISTPIPDVTDNSLLNAGGILGKAAIGNIETNENGDIKDSIHNKNIGMNALYTLLLIILLIFVFGSYGKKK